MLSPVDRLNPTILWEKLMVQLDFILLRAEVANAARQAFKQVQASHPNERFYAFALYSDDSAMTIMPAANSGEALERTTVANGESSPSAWSRWGTAEWLYESEGNEHFNVVYSLLNAPDAYEDDDFEEFRTQVFQTMVDALSDLEAEGFFGRAEAREAVTVFCSISDSDDAEELENTSARQLNPGSVYQKFAARYAGEE